MEQNSTYRDKDDHESNRQQENIIKPVYPVCFHIFISRVQGWVLACIKLKTSTVSYKQRLWGLKRKLNSLNRIVWDLPSVHFPLLTQVRSRWKQVKRNSTDIPLTGNVFQLLLGDPGAFPGQMRHIISPACSGSALRSPTSPGEIPIRCLNHLLWLL